jgi:hypothetical protein
MIVRVGAGILRPLRRRCWLSAAARLLPAISSVLLLVACASGSTGGGTPSKDATEAVCQVVRSPTATKAVSSLLDSLSGDTWGGSLAADLLIGDVQNNCESLLSGAIKLAERVLDANPGQAGAPVGDFQSLSFAQDGQIATELNGLGYQGVSAASVGTLVTDLCQDTQGSRGAGPVQDIQSLMPGADLQALHALNGVDAQVVRTCTPLLSGSQADELLSGMENYLISNGPHTGAPITVSFQPNPACVGSGVIRVQWLANFQSADYEVWSSTGGQWKNLHVHAHQTSIQVNLAPGQGYEFAVRATLDDNASPWEYTSPGLRCQ